MAKNNKRRASGGTSRNSGPQALLNWLRRTRRDAQVQAMRGAAYSVGSGAVGLLFLWMRHHL
jgi:hypothetical protein